MTTTWAGCDPGLTGAIAFLTETGEAHAYALPLRDHNGQREVDGVALMSLLDDFGPLSVMLEQVQGFGGCSSAFKLGQSYGTIIVATLSSRYRLERVRPQTWQKAVLGLSSSTRKDTKAASIAFVKKYYPSVDLRMKPTSKVLHDGIADAVCLAHYARSLSHATHLA